MRATTNPVIIPCILLIQLLEPLTMIAETITVSAADTSIFVPQCWVTASECSPMCRRSIASVAAERTLSLDSRL